MKNINAIHGAPNTPKKRRNNKNRREWFSRLGHSPSIKYNHFQLFQPPPKNVISSIILWDQFYVPCFRYNKNGNSERAREQEGARKSEREISSCEPWNLSICAVLAMYMLHTHRTYHTEIGIIKIIYQPFYNVWTRKGDAKQQQQQQQRR